MKKIVRNLSTQEGKAFWKGAARIAAQAEQWPESKRAQINVSPNPTSRTSASASPREAEAPPKS